jgi:prepilin-type processing-associated H-X9-DG protein
MSDSDLRVYIFFSVMCDRMMQLFVDGHAAPFVDGKIYHVLISLLTNAIVLNIKAIKKKT